MLHAAGQAHQVVQVDKLLQRQELVSDQLRLLRQPIDMHLLTVRTLMRQQLRLRSETWQKSLYSNEATLWKCVTVYYLHTSVAEQVRKELSIGEPQSQFYAINSATGAALG